jgi:PAS domain S-box-containing protein
MLINLPSTVRLRRRWIPYGILAVILGLTYMAARNMALLKQAKERAKFDQAVVQSREHLQRQVNGYLVLLDGFRGLANAKLAMNAEQFNAYVEALQLRRNYPGIQGLGFAMRVPQARKEASIQARRQQGDPKFHIWPDSNAAEMFPILYFAPPDPRNAAEIGRDFYADPAARAALDRATETGEPATSDQFGLTLGAGDRSERGFLLVSPIYFGGKAPETREERFEKIFGFFFCAFQTGELFKVLSASQVSPQVSFQIYDGATLDPSRLLYDSAAKPGPAALDPNFISTQSLAVADRPWMVVFAKREEFVVDSRFYLDPFLVVLGVGLGLILFWLTRVQVKARSAAERHAEAQRLAETHFRGLVEQSIVGIYLIQKDRFTYVNPRMAEIFGYSTAELTSTSLLNFIAEESRPTVRENVRRRLEGEIESVHYALRALRKDGRIIDTEAHGSRVEFNGQPAILGCLIDITERKQAERRLEAQLSRLDLLSRTTRAIGERQDLRSIFQVVIRRLEDNLPVDFSCVCLHDPLNETLIVTSVGVRSEALAMELALTEQANVNIDPNGLSECVRGRLVYEPDTAHVSFPFPQRLARGGLRSLVAAPLLVESKVFGVLIVARRQAEGFSSGECEFLRQLSEHVALAANQAQLYQALQQAFDDLRQSQQTVMQQERLRALGQMASGIAHDINNAISPVALYTESLLAKEPNLSPRAREYLETIERAIDDVAATVTRMREFYRQREPQLTLGRVSLNELVPQVVRLTHARWSDMPQQRGVVIETKMELEPDLPAIMGVENEIRDALTNLIFNAVDAMPEGGTLTVRTRALKTAPASGEPPATPSVLVEVADTGMGMDEDTRRRCLEPFYTTKGERGTGLGLAMVYGTMQRHRAAIEIESIVGQGTTMRLVFAAAEEEISDPSRTSTPRTMPSRLRILVVDDDPLLLKSLRDILEVEGHFVVTANSGQVGIDAFVAAHQGTEPFAVVITDLGMPYVDGRKVASAVKEASPSTPVILLTGWGRRLIAEGDIPPHVDQVLSKPPKLGDLRDALARCCADAPS